MLIWYTYEIIKIFCFYESTQIDVIAAMELERLFRETNHDMILVDSPVVVAYEKETRSFPCRICGAIYITVVHS